MPIRSPENRSVIEALRHLYNEASRQRLDLRVYDWALRATNRWAEAHGKTGITAAEKAQALLEKFNEVRLPSMDADEAAVAFAAAAMSQGLHVALLGESYSPDGQIQHIVVEILDEDKRHRFDPLYGKGPGDHVDAPTRVIRMPDRPQALGDR